MTDSYVSQAQFDNIIAPALRRAFATAKMLGVTVDLTVYRDTDQDGVPVPVVIPDVLMDFAAREPTQINANANRFAGADGDFQHEAPFDVQTGDTFRLAPVPPETIGASGKIEVVYPPDEIGIVRATFTLRR